MKFEHVNESAVVRSYIHHVALMEQVPLTSAHIEAQEAHGYESNTFVPEGCAAEQFGWWP